MRMHSMAAALMVLSIAWLPRQAPAHGDDPIQEAALSPRDRQDLAALRAATAMYHDFDAASAEGLWAVPITGCMETGDGGMGYHYAKFDNFGTLDPTRPQALLFEPEKDGSMRLVGVEFIVPDGGTAGVKDSAPPPPLFGQQFEYVPDFDVWGLHAWVWRYNPAGMFAAWNPSVTCAYGTP
jgi:hypothetical protein